MATVSNVPSVKVVKHPITQQSTVLTLNMTCIKDNIYQKLIGSICLQCFSQQLTPTCHGAFNLHSVSIIWFMNFFLCRPNSSSIPRFSFCRRLTRLSMCCTRSWATFSASTWGNQCQRNRDFLATKTEEPHPAMTHASVSPS